VDLQRKLFATEDEGGLAGRTLRALNRALASSAIRAAWLGMSISRTSSQPRVPNWPRRDG
jgi:hypothetical protein